MFSFSSNNKDNMLYGALFITCGAMIGFQLGLWSGLWLGFRSLKHHFSDIEQNKNSEIEGLKNQLAHNKRVISNLQDKVSDSDFMFHLQEDIITSQQATIRSQQEEINYLRTSLANLFKQDKGDLTYLSGGCGET